MKKLLSVILAIMMLCTLSACSSGDGGSAVAGSSSSAQQGSAISGGDPASESDTALGDGEIYEVVMQYPTLGTTPEDLQMMEDRLNERLESELGVHVTFYPISAFEINSTTNLMVSSGEKLDLMMSIFEGGVGPYVNKGILLELDELVDTYGQDIVAAEGIAMSGGYFNGKLYAVPTEEKMGRVKSFEMRKDLMEKYNIAYDPDHIYTYDDLTEIFTTVKEGEGSGFYSIAVSSGDGPPIYNMSTADTLGSTFAAGCLPDFGKNGTTIVNYFETDEFLEGCQYARDWYQKGFFAPDANTLTDSSLSLFETGNYLGMIGNSEPDMIASHSSAAQAYLGTDVVPFYTTPTTALTQHYQITLWALPITCENPEKTMQWLNLLYKDQDIINLVYRGIEGVHWNYQEGSDTVVEYPEGIDASNTPYQAILNVWGDKSKDYVIAPLDETYYQQLADFNNSIEDAHTSIALGYCFNSDPVKTEFAAVSDVISQYELSLGMGIVDPDTVIPEFQQALKAAGIDAIIAENQKQFDAWLSEKQ